MKLKTEVTSDRLRGGYYTPEELVAFCWRRIRSLMTGSDVRVLEPAAGDGQFFGAIEADLRTRIAHITAVEIDPIEARKCEARLRAGLVEATVVPGSFLQWALADTSTFDVAVGNPPFVRFQFVSEDDSAAATVLGLQLHVRFEGVSNLWIPILLGALAKLRDGGAFSFVVPAELFTGVSAGVVRQWLLETARCVSIDMFPAGSFGDVLQEIAILSGQRVAQGTGDRRLEIVAHRGGASERSTHQLEGSTSSWTRLLLSPAQLAAYDEATSLPAVHAFGDVARLQVSIVTGANDYFCVGDEVLEAFGLTRWRLPLLPRIRYASGLIWSRGDQGALASRTRRWLLHFSDEAPSPERFVGARRYLELGRERGIPLRYKCTVRDPWYRVPDVWAGSLLLSKRSHRMPRLVLNAARSYTTDTIYRGRMRAALKDRERDLVAGFHNSLTLLTSELEGRSFGGGVHELVPSEIARLRVLLVPAMGENLEQLDGLLRRGRADADGEAALVDATNDLLVRADVGLTTTTLDTLNDARHQLMWRRLERSGSASADVAGEIDLLAV